MKEQFSYRAYKWFVQQVTNNRNANQINRLEKTDWDILVILDACRVNPLRSIANWPVETVVSPASCTPEWLRELEQTEILDNHIGRILQNSAIHGNLHIRTSDLGNIKIMI